MRTPKKEGEGAAALDAICQAGGEGLISKRRDAHYRSGRSSDWIKSKCIRRAEFFIAGRAPSDKRGRPFASLLLGSHEAGRLVYRGRVGTGFDADDFAELNAALDSITRKTPPFDGDLPPEADGAQWVTPKLVAEVEYTEFTAEGRIRITTGMRPGR